MKISQVLQAESAKTTKKINTQNTNNEVKTMSKTTLDVYYDVVYSESSRCAIIFTTEKAYYDRNHYLQYDEEDPVYERIRDAMNSCGYYETIESGYEVNIENVNNFDHKAFVAQLARFNINMIRNEGFSHS